VSVCTWLSHWVRRRTARHQTRSTSSSCDSSAALSTSPQPVSLVRLPTELILLISELLPAADAVCLALTCKRMCCISNIRYLGRRLDSDATESLLCRLERETTGVSYCIVDQKLARFTTYRPAGLHLHYNKAWRTREPPSVNFRRSLVRLPYCTARLATNHQIIGPGHGLPASSLARI
jgi:hypothetical protein